MLTAPRAFLHRLFYLAQLLQFGQRSSNRSCFCAARSAPLADAGSPPTRPADPAKLAPVPRALQMFPQRLLPMKAAAARPALIFVPSCITSSSVIRPFALSTPSKLVNNSSNSRPFPHENPPACDSSPLPSPSATETRDRMHIAAPLLAPLRFRGCRHRPTS